jgi:hypothetical protein
VSAPVQRAVPTPAQATEQAKAIYTAILKIEPGGSRATCALIGLAGLPSGGANDRDKKACRCAEACQCEEVDDPDPDDPEIQQGERQEAERQEAERQEAERQEAERQEAERQEAERQEPERQEPERQEREIQEPEIQEWTG